MRSNVEACSLAPDRLCPPTPWATWDRQAPAWHRRYSKRNPRPTSTRPRSAGQSWMRAAAVEASCSWRLNRVQRSQPRVCPVRSALPNGPGWSLAVPGQFGLVPGHSTGAPLALGVNHSSTSGLRIPPLAPLGGGSIGFSGLFLASPDIMPSPADLAKTNPVVDAEAHLGRPQDSKPVPQLPSITQGS